MADPGRKLLSSWKEIASYLARDLSTVSRWEKQFGLPVHRVGGEKGRSVFAYADEIDEWLARHKQDGVTELDAPANPELLKRNTSGIRRWSYVGLAGMVLATFAWTRHETVGRIDRVSFSAGQLIAYDAEQNVRWTATPSDVNPNTQLLGHGPVVIDLDRDGAEDVLVGVAGDSSLNNDGPSASSQLLSLARDGEVRWRVNPGRRLRMGNADYEGPWFGQSWLVLKTLSTPLVAIAVRHWTWWPSILATVDASGKVAGEFVNAGWIYVIKAVDDPSNPLLLAGGVSNSQDAGMLAVLDAEHVKGSSPEETGSAYECSACPQGKPLQYFVFPRTEINRVTASLYNRVDEIQVLSDRVIVNTRETAGILEQTEGAINGIYEFTRDMEIKKADFHHKYWDLHRRLEIEGKLDHTRDECAERNGPLSIRSWTREKGWKEILLRP